MADKYDWRWENSVSHTKERVEAEGHRYVPFRTNRYLSRFIDSLSAAQDMNLNPHLDPELQYDYLFYSVRKRRRFARGARPVADDRVALVAERYGCSEARAREYLAVLTEEEAEALRLNKGG